MLKNRPLIAATIGDPAGIGPEVCVKAAQGIHGEGVFDVLLIGDIQVIQTAAEICGCHVPFRRVSAPRDGVRQNFIGVLDPRGGAAIEYLIGEASASAARAALEWLSCGHDLGSRGLIDGLVLGPVNSEALKLSGLIQHIDQLQPEGTYMLRVSGNLRVMPLTEHIPIRDVAATVSSASVMAAVSVLDEALRKWGVERPRIAVAGLNPHAMFEEDATQIAPAVQALSGQGVGVIGPISPDSVFRKAFAGDFDAVVAMYHDQGQIALKTAAFSGACTIYVGLSHVEIAIPHGTAYDIAGKGTADSSSMAAGMRMAARLVSGAGFN
ncbi:PdxA family dehydrogenase [Ferribacterium limneticum]|uniref:PdxA family dehydrogenase n=1 Tax=Ferribacterium limneticum TaxID=76259 RepID=UPI001CF99FFF|nr:4-hydroxythreonine-4-phosphate dehydrogenase PdxA [Ferribacterium limneticum]UCV17773.1 4-hydroxythreonine-4-phosphate dehydrogenase PdxA [Ferribacterium limneticum]